MTEQAADFLRAELQRLDSGALPEQVQTHISVLLLGRTLVWKRKKAVKLPYLDTRSPDRRLLLCERELELNRRTAPTLYRRVRRLVRSSGGSLQLDGDGDLVEPLLEMSRFDASGLLDGVATRGELTPAVVTGLARVIAAFHLAAAPAPGLARGGAQRVGDILQSHDRRAVRPGLHPDGPLASRSAAGGQPAAQPLPGPERSDLGPAADGPLHVDACGDSRACPGDPVARDGGGGRQGRGGRQSAVDSERGTRLPGTRGSSAAAATAAPHRGRRPQRLGQVHGCRRDFGSGGSTAWGSRAVERSGPQGAIRRSA